MNMTPCYSIIIPAYNEEKWLARTLPYLKQSMDMSEVSGEVIVVDNNSTDGTALTYEYDHLLFHYYSRL
jgi:glycosyltransferase involved in cell wall biosynthesis